MSSSLKSHKLKPGTMALITCALAAALIVPVQNVIASLLISGPDPDLLYFNSPSAVKKLSLGYESLVADLYWIRTIQYFGRREEAAKRVVPFKNLANLLDLTTTLDPDLIDAYCVGSSFLSEGAPVGAGEPLKAIQLLDKGIAAHPQEWRLPFNKGLVYFWFVKDYRKAGEAWHAASRLSTSPQWMESLAAMSLSKSDAADTAKMIWQRQYEQSTRADVRENARNHLISLKVSEDLWTLEFLAGKYRDAFGKYPASLKALRTSGLLKADPSDPLGTPYEYDSNSGKSQLSRASWVRFVDVPTGYHDSFVTKLEQKWDADERR
jgi:tetratricopeptide (TPR) repeat protein